MPPHRNQFRVWPALKMRSEKRLSNGICSTNETSATESGHDRVTQRRLGGLLVREYRWGLSLPAKLLLLLVVLGFGAAVVFEIYPFLAVTQRVNADELVVEGWMHPYGIHAGIEEFRKGNYQKIYTTGGPVVGKGGYINDWNTSASVGAEQLKREGIAPDLVQMVPSRVAGRDRTYSSAAALREWWDEHGMRPRGINIVTEDTHARRSRLLFQKALGPDVKVGVIAVSSPDFDARHWWQYSEAVEEVIGETLAYVYAKLLFHPNEAKRRWEEKTPERTPAEQ